MRRIVVVSLVALTGCFGMMMRPSDEGITSETHRQHVGGMVFSSQTIVKGHENPATFTDSFQLGQPLYGRFYLKEALHKVASERGQFDRLQQYGIALQATVDGQVIPQQGVYPMLATWQTYNFTLVRDPSDTVPWAHPIWFLTYVAPHLTPGTHKLDLAVLAVPPGKAKGEGEPIAVGSVNLVVSPNARVAVASALARERKIQAEEQRAQEAQQAAYAASSSSESESSSSEASSGVKFVIEDDACDKNLDLIIKDGNGNSETTGIGVATEMDASIEQAPGSLCIADEGMNNCVSNEAPITASTKKVVITSCGSVHSE